MSEEELAELAEVEPAFVRRAVQAGALEAGRPGGFGAQDATRLRFLRPGTPPGCRWRRSPTWSAAASCR